ncbi:ISSpo3, transposase [Nitrococcus mobilis Nb-231]|uniref:ISSpo3, transposase n=2 Tax=Nitrococcus mobilis TaxID=35797 RepID=A4BT83_9GAMM|nr:ISSpo3, transposase [Nitrococcus mobilis Nb-231]
MLQHDGEVVIHLLENVQRATIAPLLRAAIEPGTQIYTDEYDIYNRLTDWGYAHRTVCHSHGEYARDEDGDGFHEIHVNTIEGFWSLLRSWLRPHRGISQEGLPLYLGFFKFVHNARIRGKGLLQPLLGLLLT